MSVFSRLLAGVGSAMTMISSVSILTSEYPHDVPRIIGILQIIGGLGLVIGPIAGSVMFSLGGFFYSCILIALIIFAYLPILFLIVGKSKPYVLSSDNINLVEIAMKPVILI